MKTLLRNTIFYAFALALLPTIFSGITINGGIIPLLFAGLVLAVLILIVKPIIGIISFPLNIATLGAFSLLTNALVLYLMTMFVDTVSIQSSMFGGFNVLGFAVPKVYLNTLFTYILSSAIITGLIAFLKWLID